MEDKRIIKTKRNLKETMIKLLADVPFEKITVSQICRTGETSRITFYTYYQDKYALIEEMFQDYIREAVTDYYSLQKENNPTKIALYGYYNMLDCILDLYYNNPFFFVYTSPDKNPYLYSTFFQHIFYSVDDYIKRHATQMKPKYSSRQTSSLLCNGLLGVIHECFVTEKSPDVMRNNVRNMYRDILESAIFERDLPKGK